MASTAHAKLSPSGSDRWLNCPGSVRMEQGLSDQSSPYAAEGTAAHALCEKCLTSGADAEKYVGWVIKVHKNGQPTLVSDANVAYGANIFEVDDEMVDGVQLYLDTVREIANGADEFDIEQRVVVSEDTWGTSDALAYNEKLGRLTVCDFKYGRGVSVAPDENSQLVLYAIGALKRYHNRGVKEIELVVIQPRAGGVRRWMTDAVTLLDMEVDMAEGAARTRAPDAPLKAGDWCKFCKARAGCPEIRRKSRETAEAEFADDGTMAVSDVKAMSADDMAKALSEVDVLETWCRALREHAHSEAMHGRGPTGWKLVAKRANRKWKDEDAATAALAKLGVSVDRMFTEPKLLTPAKVEPLLPGKNKTARAAVLAPLVSKESTGVVLAPAGDPRPLVVPNAETEFAD